MNLVLHAVEACHHHRGKRQVRIRRRIREAHLDAARLVRLHVRYTNRRRTIACRISQLHRRFKSWHQTLIRIGTWIGNRVQRACVLDNAADVIQGEFGKPRVTISGKQVLAIFPYRLMHVHTRTVITNDGFRHEGRGLAVAVCDVVDHVLHALNPVGALHQRRKLGADFALSRCGDFVVMYFHFDADFFECQTHRRTHVLE